MTPLAKLAVSLTFVIALFLLSTSFIVPSTTEAIDNDTRGKIVIWPVGDSITYGSGSSKSDSYRSELLSLLNPLDPDLHFTYTGSLTSGNLRNAEHEGHPWIEISPLSTPATTHLHTIPCPHLALLHIGTNDCINNRTLPNAGARLGALLDDFAILCPDMAIIIAQIIGSTHAGTQKNIDQFNAQVPGVVQRRVQSEQAILGVQTAQGEQAAPNGLLGQGEQAGQGGQVTPNGFSGQVEQAKQATPFGDLGQASQAKQATPFGDLGQASQAKPAAPFGDLGQASQAKPAAPFGDLGQASQDVKATPFGDLGQASPNVQAAPNAYVKAGEQPAPSDKFVQTDVVGKPARKYLTVNMSSALVKDDFDDWFHPNDKGYKKMAEMWFNGVVEAKGRGWI